MWKLGDQSVGVTSIENAGDLGALPARIGDVFQVWRVFELVSDVGIGESTDHVLAVKQSAEDLSFIASQRIEGLCGPFWSEPLAVDNSTDAIRTLDRITTTSARAAR